MTFTTDRIPNPFICPITGELMSDPYSVITSEGKIFHSYEKEALDKWFINNDTDPMTRRTKEQPAAPAPPAAVWDGKRVIEQANVPPPPQPQTEKRSESNSKAGKPKVGGKAPNSQPLPTTTRTGGLAPVLELEEEEEQHKAAKKVDEWQVVGGDVKPRARSNTLDQQQAAPMAPKPQSGTQSRSASAQPTRSISPAQPLPPVQAATPAIKDSEPTTTPVAKQTEEVQQQTQPVKRQTQQQSQQQQQQQQQQQKKKKQVNDVRKDSKASKPQSVQTMPSQQQLSTQLPTHSTTLPIPQIAVAGGLVLVSIVSYYLFM